MEYSPVKFKEKMEKYNFNLKKMFGQNFIIECIPDPSIAMIKARLIKYIVQDGVEYIFYDYICLFSKFYNIILLTIIPHFQLFASIFYHNLKYFLLFARVINY